MRIAIGSHNPVKIAATRNVMLKIFPQVKIIPVEVDSKVSRSPRSDEEAIAGARARGKQAFYLTNAELGVGLEGGATTIDGKYMTAGWAAIFNGDRYCLGGGGHLLLPPAVEHKIKRERKELGDAMDELTGGENTKQKMGAIGILTKGLSNRQRAYECILVHAGPHLFCFQENPPANRLRQFEVDTSPERFFLAIPNHTPHTAEPSIRDLHHPPFQTYPPVCPGALPGYSSSLSGTGNGFSVGKRIGRDTGGNINRPKFCLQVDAFQKRLSRL